ncbi:hypothetical protein ACO0LL_30140, partial [Undibacterium sp. TC4M20W]|uniref:hypothetical protein n=1 Tax=Undibacterium sp. TC4M20W TaxID=3413052 RepID=UPI003BF3CC13
NRTVKRLRANDSAATSVKVGYRQAFIPHTPAHLIEWGFCFCADENTPTSNYAVTSIKRIKNYVKTPQHRGTETQSFTEEGKNSRK